MRTFHAVVGLSDSSPSGTTKFSIEVDEELKGQANVEVGKTSELNVDVTGGFRLTVKIERAELSEIGCGVTPVLIDPVLRP